MNKIYLSFISFILLISCGTKINYLGSNYSPTKQVDVFVDASAIKKDYSIIGKGYIEYGYGTRGQIERMQPKAVALAKEKGADAILFRDYYVTENSGDIYTTSTKDSSKKASQIVTNATVKPVIANNQEILFLKYSE